MCTNGSTLLCQMTAQINDTVFHRKIGYTLAAISGSGLFKPQSVGIEPVSMSTACWRGYYVEYAVEDERLFLTQVALGLSKADELRAKAGGGPTLFGIHPRYISQRCEWVYEGVHEPVPFTGGFLLGDGFIRELYVHMGFHPAWKYREVRELLFENGCLRSDLDRSREMEGVRSKLAAEPLRPVLGDKTAIKYWVEKCFSRDYTPNADSGAKPTP
jgi:hypothetical protein